jgi:hypothetical protein
MLYEEIRRFVLRVFLQECFVKQQWGVYWYCEGKKCEG